jgi:hypothetical protein
MTVIMLCIYCVAFSAYAVETQILKVKISDIEARPMEGAKLFIYNSPNVRRPADFISSLSDRAGLVQISLPPGKYWTVARYKSDGKYGPLMPGDKHSGEPLEVDITAGGAEADFIVADIRELGQKKKTAAADLLKLSGRVLDVNGMPVAQTFVFANVYNEFFELPGYISAWTGDDGKYELYLPQGATYYIGTSRQFPLEKSVFIAKPITVESGKIGVATIIDLTVQ